MRHGVDHRPAAKNPSFMMGGRGQIEKEGVNLRRSKSMRASAGRQRKTEKTTEEENVLINWICRTT